MPTEPSIREKDFLSWVRVHGLFRHEMEAYFTAHGFSPAQWGAMRTLRRAELVEGPAGLTLGELGRRMLVKPPSVSGVVERLRGRGLVACEVSPDDHRAKRVRLTEAGRASLQTVLTSHPAQRDRIFAGLDADERATFFQLLEKLEHHLEGLRPEDTSLSKK